MVRMRIFAVALGVLSWFGPVLSEEVSPLRQRVLSQAPSVLFVTRKQYRKDHHNTATLFQCGEVNEKSYDTEGCLKILDVKSGRVETLFDPGKGATVRDPDVSFDGKRVVFAMRKNASENYHIYTIDLETRAVKQLTRQRDVTDVDPCWLPDGGIVFASTREPKYCGCNNRIMCNLFRMEGDGANIYQIGRSTLFEAHPFVMDDGRILYDRWEYVDRDFGSAQGLWTCNPDGTAHALYWGNNTESPGGILNARTLPGDGSRVLAVLGACHNRPWGALGLIDRKKGIDGPVPVIRTWPSNYLHQVCVSSDKYRIDSPNSVPLKYQDPFPLDDAHYLCVRQMDAKSEATGIFCLDASGAEELLYAEAPGCFDPMPIRPRKLPPVRPRQRNFDSPHAPGRFYLQNVMIGTHMEGVAPGTIKALRVIESPEKRNWTHTYWGGQGTQWPGMNWLNFENKRILGTVPVEADGSAYFEVPGNTFVFFQALDEKGMMVQSMRSGTYVQPGETYGCVGCHENRIGGTPVTDQVLAMRRPPSRLDGWQGMPLRLFSFQREVQPIFNRHCVSCHDYGKPAAEKLNLAGDRDTVFSTSYVDLWLLGGISCVGAGGAETRPALSWGSRVSKIVRMSQNGHGRVQLSKPEMDTLIAWCDLNAPYYPNFECAYPQNQAGRSPLSFAEVKRVQQLSGVKLADQHWYRQRSQFSFDRPEVSRILTSASCATNESARAEVLSIIRKGQERLYAKPRNDMDGFYPCEKDVARLNKYEKSQAREEQVYAAIREGRKLYDEE